MAECTEKIVIANSREANAVVMKSIIEQEGCNAVLFDFVYFSEIKKIIEKEKPLLAIVEVPPFITEIKEATDLFREKKDILFLITTTDTRFIKNNLQSFPNIRILPEPFDIDTFSEFVMEGIKEIRERKVTREREN